MKEKTSKLKDPDVIEIIKRYPPEHKLPRNIKNLKGPPSKRGNDDGLYETPRNRVKILS